MRRLTTRRLLCLCLLGAGLPWPAQADGLSDLGRFLAKVTFGTARFTQTVTAPPRPGEAQGRRQQSSGVLSFIRPDRLRFEYLQPFRQIIVADGEKLWFHDPELAQATVRPQREALLGTPAALIATAPDLVSLGRGFTLRDEAVQDKAESLVLATPIDAEGPLAEMRIRFRHGELSTLEVLDRFGQTSVIRFAAVDDKRRPDAALFRFVPPPGTDVIEP